MYYASGYLLKKTYKKDNHKIEIRRLIKCPICKFKDILSGNPGEKVSITCPKCNEKGIMNFPEEQMEYKASNKTYAIDVDSSLQNRINGASLLAGLTYMWSYFIIFNLTLKLSHSNPENGIFEIHHPPTFYRFEIGSRVKFDLT